MDTDTDMHQDRRSPTADPAEPLSSRDLFGSARALIIAHNGEKYHLRITRNGKLILTK